MRHRAEGDAGATVEWSLAIREGGSRRPSSDMPHSNECGIAVYAACCRIELRTLLRVASSMVILCFSRPCCSIFGMISCSLFPLTCQSQFLGPTSEHL